MDEIFLHPPFDAPDLLARILGPSRRRPPRPATLAGHALRSDADGLRVALVPAPGGRVAGASARRCRPPRAPGSTSPWRRSAPRRRRSIAETGGARGSSPGLPLRPETRLATGTAARRPRDRAPARLGEALAEVMGHFGRRRAGGDAGASCPASASARWRGRAGRRPGARAGSARASAPATSSRSSASFSYARFFAVEEHRLRHRRFDGGMSDALDRAVFTSGDAVTVLPFDPRARTPCS